ncbi:hypothetical protein HS088_TW16G00562 [Tripterygium wilfordii]|uniref:glycerophosphodiester phosphodiesterase n=1 Tax=Tripterygium wilfordii TaxID=458696 RepID=A0A7J7CJ92_TRIWF|nr:hypothetical protein HS088_TW16G00562 [Tripterygium wilfordii]
MSGSQRREGLQKESTVEAFFFHPFYLEILNVDYFKLHTGLEAQRAVENVRKSPAFPVVKGISSSKTPSAAKEGSNSQASPEQEEVKPKVTSDDGKFVKPADRKTESKKPTLSNGIAEDEAMEMMRKMPSVTATGDGPNGRRIEGFLYNYLKGKFPIITFEEFIAIALDAPRIVGIYPEIKNPVFINQHVKWQDGKKFEDKFVETLKKYGYKGSYLSKDWLKQPAFIQSFAPTSLVYVSKLTELPKIFLIDDVTVPTQDTNQSYWEITSDAYFDYIKEYVVGIGPWKDTVVPVINNYLQTPSDLVARAHAHDLQVHPYTFRNENQFLHFNFSEDPYAEYNYWINKIGVDGLFTDFTGSLHNFQEWTAPLSPDDNHKASRLLHKIERLIASYGRV